MSTPTPHNLVKDITGKSFGKLTVLSWAGTGKRRQALWLCRCQCGTETTKRGDLLRSGKTTSCGCLKREAWRNTVTHGQAGPSRRTSLYNTWVLMKARCSNPNRPDFARYGARGIEVCAAWRESFEAFAAYVGERPGDGYTLDRIDNDGNYEPGNVRWATASEQARNRRPRAAA